MSRPKKLNIGLKLTPRQCRHLWWLMQREMELAACDDNPSLHGAAKALSDQLEIQFQAYVGESIRRLGR